MPTGAEGIYRVPGTGAIWLLYNNEWHWCPTQESFLAWGYSWANLQTIDLATWCQKEVGQPLTDDGSGFAGNRGYIPSGDREALTCPVRPPPPPPPPPPETLKCPLCERDLGIRLSEVANIEIISSPVVDQLLADIANLEAKIRELQGRISSIRTEIARHGEILGL